MRIFILDNYDSFTYNLYHITALYADEVVVKRNDAFNISEIEAFDKVIISPGPGLPKDVPVLNQVFSRYQQKEILGVCLGHQALAEYAGGELFNMKIPIHGQSRDSILIKKDTLFQDVPQRFAFGRYHSWAVARNRLPQSLEILAEDDDGVIMALKHKTYPFSSVQFHPESVLTPWGRKILKNWVTG